MKVSSDQRTSPLASRLEGAKLRSNKIRVDVADGPDAGSSADLPGPEARVGTAKNCEFVLTDPTVSRLHVVLRIKGDALRVIDPGSHNGTAVDGTRVRDAFARPDSAIVIGRTTLRLRMLSDVVELPLSSSDHFGKLLGSSVAMRRVFSLLERVAMSDTTVLIEGETGTGKELAAAGVHEASPRSGGPFVVFDCSAVSPELMEGELFGHVRGAFTTAIADRKGAFEEADGGTLFLDEIGELPLELQPKLLRALESRQVRRVGSNLLRSIDVRIVAATNRLLLREVDRGTFREDLYYRLAVVTARLPPLRERCEDIPMLARHFESTRALRTSSAPLPDAFVAALAAQAWPGNVRELRNAIERLMSLGWDGARSAEPDVDALARTLHVTLDVPLLIGRERLLEAYEKAYVRLALGKAEGNVCRAAELSVVGRKFIQKAMTRYALRGGAHR